MTRLLMIADDQVNTDELLYFLVTKGYELTVANYKKDELNKTAGADLYLVGIANPLSAGLSAMKLLSNENFRNPNYSYRPLQHRWTTCCRT